MNGYHFTVTCLGCGALLQPHTSTPGNHRTIAIASCTECATRYQLTLTLDPLPAAAPCDPDAIPDAFRRGHTITRDQYTAAEPTMRRPLTLPVGRGAHGIPSGLLV